MRKIRKSIPYTLMVWPYLFFLIFLLPEGALDYTRSIFIWTYIGLTVVVYGLNILNALVPGKEHDARRLAFYDMLIKLVHIPFYLAVFVFGVLMLAVMVVPALVLIPPLIIMMLFVIDTFLMWTSSAYGLSASVKAARQGALSKRKAVRYGIFHYIFVTDVISAVLLYIALKKSGAEPTTAEGTVSAARG